MSSYFYANVFANNKTQMAKIKRAFRKSLDEKYNVIKLENDYDKKTSANLFVDTQSTFDWENDNVEVRTSLVDDKFVLTIKTENKHFNRNVNFSLFMDNEIRKEIIEKLSDVKIN